MKIMTKVKTDLPHD